MQCDLKKILLTTCCLTLSACGGTGIDGPIFSLDPITPTPDTGAGDYVYSPIDLTETHTFKVSSVVLEYIDHDTLNDRSKYPIYSALDLDDQVAGSESNPTQVNINGNATMHYDISDGSFNLTVDQGSTNFFHNFLESERDVGVTDRLYYESILGNELYKLDISKPGASSWGQLALNYMSYGMWSARAYPAPVPGARTSFGGITFGIETQDSDMPTSGLATYSGGTVGQLDTHYEGEVLNKEAFDIATADALLAGNPAPDASDYTIIVNFHNTFTLAGDVALDVNFTSNSLRADFTNMSRTDEDGVTSSYSQLNFHSSLSLTPGSNNFSGQASTENPWLHGTLTGAFYGPATSGAPEEVGGIWSLYDAADQTVRAVGSFGAKKN